MYGSPDADGTVSYDLCDACLHLVEKAVNEVAENVVRVPKNTKS